MFRFFKLYSLYMNNTGLSASQKSCMCEKLPRAMLDVTVNRFNVCELCGLIRRPRTCSSDEEEKLDAERQKILLQRRRAEEAAQGNKAPRFKVAVKGKKPHAKSSGRRTKSDNWNRTEGGGLGEAGDGDGPKEASKMGRRQLEPSAPPPSSPSPARSGSPGEDLPSNYARRRLIYDDQLIKKFIPLKGPITDPSGGAISKRSGSIWDAPNYPQGPLSKDKLQGGGLSSLKSRGKYTESQLASQFPPFDDYDGPSEDALIVDSARRMLNRPNSLYMEPRPDLPNNRIGNYGSSLGHIWFASQSISSAPKPKIPEPPFSPFNQIINKPLSEHIKDDTKGCNKSSDTSSSPIQLRTNAEEAVKSEEILQNLGLMEFSYGNDETTVDELPNVASPNKTMTDEEYLKVVSRELGTHGGESIIIGGLKESEEKNTSTKNSISVKNHEKSDPRERSNYGKTSEKLESRSLERISSKESVCPVPRGKYFKNMPMIIQSITPRNPVVVPVVEKQNPLERLFTRKLETLEKVQHVCGDLPVPQASYVRELSSKLSVSCVQVQPALSVSNLSEVLPKDCQDTCQDSRHEVDPSSRLEMPIPLVANPKKLLNRKTIPGEERFSEAKSLPSKCNQCRRPIRNQAANSNSRKISKGELQLLMLKLASKQRVCPLHLDTAKKFLCTHKINNRFDILEKDVNRIPVAKMLFTWKLETFETVYHMSVDLPKVHLVVYVRQLSGKLSESYLQNQHSMSFHKFCLPNLGIPPRATLQTKKEMRAVWPSMRPLNSSRSTTLEENSRKNTKTMTAMKRKSLKLIEETELKRHSQVEDINRPRSPVREPETSQDSENEREMIVAIVKHFRSIRKPLRKKSRGF